MKMTTATRVAAIAVGLSLAGATAFAAPNDGRRGNDNDKSTASEQDDNKGDRKGRRGGGDNNQSPAANQPAPVAPQAAPPTRDRQARDNRRGRNDLQMDRRAPPPAVRNDNNRRDYGNRNDRRNTGDRNDRRRDYGDRNDRRDYNRNDRRRVDIQQYRRNYNAPRRYRVGTYRWRDGYSYNRYRYGQRLPRHFYGRNFWLSNFLIYGLFAPPPGYVWVRYGPDALLIDEYTGEIVQIRYNMFYS